MDQSERDELLRPRALIRRLKIPDDASVAEVGVGTGFFTLHLADAVPRGRVIATDIRQDHLAIASRRLAAAHRSNVETRVVGADTTGLLPESIDLILMCQVDQHLRDRVAYFRSLTGCLRPKGRIAIVNFARYHQVNSTAVRAASLDITDEWSPSPQFFLLVAKPLPA